ncbi:hypothetical protein LSH36_637g01015 [Paralvinella palmiformis]|uniref:E3 ubiquitin-protein ligase UBR4 N-terminal domain-containing protein n=1 Tax=Paralvinella palmiformis TaxID=53620 RepID=A0AAD9J458_9ANNE|nr:hypothetical protein LSH36_637g01015 [Paralvinella palmiformis]
MHRNPLLVKVALSITKVAKAFERGPQNGLDSHVPLPMSRLILIMDYLLHYFYDPPAQLMEQACSFLLCHQESIDYNEFYSACIDLLLAGCRADKSQTTKFTLLSACSVQYHFLLTWRLLACLPPSVQYLKLLEQARPPTEYSLLLHSLRWLPRFANKTFQIWTRDFLAKQGLSLKQAETLLIAVVKNTDNITYDASMVRSVVEKQVLPQPELPSLSDIYMLDAVVAKVVVSLDDTLSKSNVVDARNLVQESLPGVLHLIGTYTMYIRSCLLHQVKPPSGDVNMVIEPDTLQAYSCVLGIGSTHSSRLSNLGTTLMGYLPGSVRSVVEKWGSQVATEFPAVGAWMSHLATLSNQTVFMLNSSLKHALHALVRFCGNLITVVINNVCFSHLDCIQTVLTLERVFGTVDSVLFTAKIYDYAIRTCYDLIIHHSGPESAIDEAILYECLSFLENQLNKPGGKEAIERFFTDKAAEKDPTEKCYQTLCSSISKIVEIEHTKLQQWLSKMLMGNGQEQSHIGEEVPKAILNALIPMGSHILSPTSEGIGFSELMVVMATLAGAGSGSGHTVKTYLIQKNVLEKIQENITTGKVR